MQSLEFNELKQQVISCMDGIDDIADSQNLVEVGLTSLKIMRLAAKWRKQGTKVTFSQLMKNPDLNSWYKLISGGSVRKNEDISLDPINYDKSFELTDVQYAYLIGRQESQTLGGVDCHAYIEFDGKNIDTERLCRAWQELLASHPMLHTKFNDNGTQQVMADIPENPVKINDFRELSAEKCEKELENTRKRISHRKLDIENGKCAGLELSLLPGNRHRIHFDLALLVADVQSMNIILRDLARLYNGEKVSDFARNFSFESYIQKERDNDAYNEAKEYWQKRIKNLPASPQLPLAKQAEEIKQFRVKRNLMRLSLENWQNIKEKAASYKVTPAVVLLSAYAAVLERWSSSPDFLINIPLFNRRTDIDGIDDVAADFTTLVLLEIHSKNIGKFDEFMLSVQEQFYNDISHKAYSGVKVQRDMAKYHQGQTGIAPVVFACNLGTPIIDDNFRENLGDFSYMVSQTPQVWIDFQTYEDENGLMLAWDELEELFPKGMIADMFAAFGKLLERLSSEEWSKYFDVLPENQKIRRKENLNIGQSEPHYIHTAFMENAMKNPERTVLVDSKSGNTVSYGELAETALKIGEFFRQKGISGEPVAVTIPRGTDQIKAVYGILTGGNHYVPVSVSQPFRRRSVIHSKTGIKYVITSEAVVNEIEQPENTEVFTIEGILKIAENYKIPTPEQYLSGLDEKGSDSVAYIIMTSGSTGEPKGVQIQHRAAWNTIADINSSYGINENDTAFAISAIDFDLSVYDMFGIPSAGGKIICIPEEEKKNAFYWLENVERYNVTVWNSVPALLDMLLLAHEEKSENPLSVRAAMISGDWINLDLPERLEKAAPNSKFIAMGGATEASIWSNYCDVKLPLPKEWKSIPYGSPLKNQVYRVADDKNRDCPDWVKGELLIGGAGVALGYKGDEVLTAAKFTEENGMRFYHTGDMGRFWNDGTIEFLGRKDFQVKVGGHRIELGEIESALESLESVKKAAVIAVGEERHLAAYIVPDENKCGEIFDISSVSKDKLESEWLGYKNNFVSDTESDNPETKNKISESVKRITAYSISSVLKKCENVSVIPEYRELLNRWSEFANETAVSDADILPELVPIKEYSDKFAEKVTDVLTGKKTALELFYSENRELSPFAALKSLPFYKSASEKYIRQAGNILNSSEKKWHIAEIGSQNFEITETFISEYSDKIASYKYIVSSQALVAEAEAVLGKYPNVTVELKGSTDTKHSCDMLLAYHTMHQCRDIGKNINEYKQYLSAGAMIVFAEMVGKLYLQELSAAVLENGFINYEDMRKETKNPLFTIEQWKEILKSAGMEKTEHIMADNLGKSVIFTVQSVGTVKTLNEDRLKEKLSKYLPEYMIPKVTTVLEKFPITANGKIDRKKLAELSKKQVKHSKIKRDFSETESKLIAYWSELFGTSEISPDDNYFELGGDSLTATKLISWLRQNENTEIAISAIFENPTVEKLGSFIDRLKKENKLLKGIYRELPHCETDTENRFAPFPLTDVQYAYWIGRSNLYSLGQVGTHCYFELDMADCNIEKLNKSLNTLIKKHEMMRAVVLADGKQCILRETPDFEINVIVPNKDEINKILDETRTEMSHQVIDTSSWPLFDIRAVKYSEENTRLHISFDNIIFDGWSMFHILNEWKKEYSGISVAENLEFSFRDYVIALDSIKNTKWYEEDREYWTNRIDSFPKAPELPIIRKPDEIDVPHFARKETAISEADWNMLKTRAKKTGITPSVLLMAAFSEVLRKWSQNENFVLNLTQFNRLPFNNQVEKLVGDFTTLTMLEINTDDTNCFAERAVKIQKQLFSDLEHSFFSGVEMQRALSQNSNGQNVNMPIVFTSGLGIDQWNEGSWIGKLVYNISQTPQVWLDHQVVERDGQLCLFWDYVEALFDPHVITEMFEAYSGLIKSLAADENLWYQKNRSLIDANISEERYNANCTDGKLPELTMDEMFIKAVPQYRDKIAVISENIQLTFGEIGGFAAGIAAALRKAGTEKQDVVGIYMPKCWQQIAGVYGILFVGGVYLPLDVKNPEERIRKIIADSKLKTIITISEYAGKLSEIDGINVINADEISPDTENIPETSVNELSDLAYIIYTSGSTGTPKGVAITHGGAMNTIIDINERFNITEKDTAIGLSNLHFDLSVYDIFGLLSVGGTLVIIPDKQLRNPKYWLECIDNYNITVWNTVPAFMQMLTAYMSQNSSARESGLKKILLSGDWIPVTLPDEIRKLFRGVRISGLGGATEASIWSNIFDIPENIPENWKSIPYGKPLRNQKYYILDSNLSDCPDGVSGMLYIQGYGLAKEYYNDEQKTKEKFIFHSEKNERLYCTGDTGRYMNDGNIEFLGRIDDQIKINGYRVELGEIESAVKQCCDSEEIAAVVVSGDVTYTAVFIKGGEISSENIIAELKKRLPEYMVPAVVSAVDEIPLSSNGKVDRKKLAEKAAEIYISQENSTEKQIILPETETEKKLCEIWGNILNYENISIEDHFFEAGGNSLQVIYLINAINENFGIDIGVSEFFEHPAIKPLAEYIDQNM